MVPKHVDLLCNTFYPTEHGDYYNFLWLNGKILGWDSHSPQKTEQALQWGMVSHHLLTILIFYLCPGCHSFSDQIICHLPHSATQANLTTAIHSLHWHSQANLKLQRIQNSMAGVLFIVVDENRCPLHNTVLYILHKLKTDLYFHPTRGTEAEIHLPLKRSSFQHLFSNPSWLVWGRASCHQKLAPTFPGINSCLMVTKRDFLETTGPKMLLKVNCLPKAVGKQPSIPLIYLGRKWTLNW